MVITYCGIKENIVCVSRFLYTDHSHVLETCLDHFDAFGVNGYIVFFKGLLKTLKLCI